MSRELCHNCNYILARCLCSEIKMFISPIPILIFRVKNEKFHALNTVNILEISLKNMLIIDLDEKEDPKNLEKLILKNVESYKFPLLIYPNKNSNTSIVEKASKSNFDCVIFLDGSWKKTKRIFLQSTYLKNLPVKIIDSETKSEYMIRKSSFEYSLSTIEAVVYVLNEVENNKNFNELLKPFRKMISFQIAKMGLETFRKNYKKKE
jgi:DTW domain-containing protein YfiP